MKQSENQDNGTGDADHVWYYILRVEFFDAGVSVATAVAAAAFLNFVHSQVAPMYWNGRVCDGRE